MDIDNAQKIVEAFMQGLPDKIRETMEEVEVLIVESPTDGKKTLLEEMYEPNVTLTAEEIAVCDVPSDTKGIFIGEPLERENNNTEDDEEEDIYPPEGFIVLVASNIESEDVCVLILCHEMGHALGLDEQGVKELGLAVAAGAKAAAESKANVAVS